MSTKWFFYTKKLNRRTPNYSPKLKNQLIGLFFYICIEILSRQTFILI